MNKKLLVSALSSVLALSALAGCSNPTANTGGGTEPTQGEQTLRFGLSGFEGVFDPILSDNVYDSYVCSLIFEGLITNDPTGEVAMKLADHVDLSEDKLTYTFTLKDGIKFSDGTPCTAEDVAFTYNTIKEPDYAGPRTAVGAAIAEINVIDEKTIAFTMTDPSPANLQNFTYGILDDEYYAHSSFEELAALNDKPMGTGPVCYIRWLGTEAVCLHG